MFFRVLSAMVVADAIDRRARRRERGWAVAPAPTQAERAGRGSHEPRERVWLSSPRRDWDRRAPERP
jgi:hypothetical protein